MFRFDSAGCGSVTFLDTIFMNYHDVFQSAQMTKLSK